MSSDTLHMVHAEKSVLIADDDFYMRELVKFAIDGEASILEASTGQEVIELYKAHRPTMVFLDIHMPGSDGKALLREILKIDMNAYVVMVSADSTRNNVEETFFKGAKGFIAKPFAKDVVVQHIRRCMKMRRSGS